MTALRSVLVPPADLLVALNLAVGISRGAACRLAAHYEAWCGTPQIERPLGVPATALRAARALRATARAVACRERETAASHGAALVSLADEGFPRALRSIDLPPPALYVRGRWTDAPCVAIVGSRRASRYGLSTARWLARELAAAGFTIVSGFAVGVDAAAHRGALSCAGGRTVAVLGCGIDVDYPRGHGALGRDIAAGGALISEFPFGCTPAAWHFPVRNRLIAALAEACIVVEAAPRSGSLTTARLALEQGREVLAVPGRVSDELALGPNQLIADGARPLLDPRDVLDAIAPHSPRPADLGLDEPAGLDDAARTLWRAAVDSPAVAETLAARCGLTADAALSALLSMELAGHLRRAPDGVYRPCGVSSGLRGAKSGW